MTTKTYRFLEVGEEIKVGDEWLRDTNEWFIITQADLNHNPPPYICQSHRPWPVGSYRREIQISDTPEPILNLLF